LSKSPIIFIQYLSKGAAKSINRWMQLFYRLSDGKYQRAPIEPDTNFLHKGQNPKGGRNNAWSEK